MQASGVHFTLSVEEAAKLWECKYETESQTVGFNHPRQLAAEAAYSNKLSDADVYKWAVQPGDLLLLATDGVWDNLRPVDVRAALATMDWAPVATLVRARRRAYLEGLKIERTINGPVTSSATASGGMVEFGSGKGTVLERFKINGAIGVEVGPVSPAAVAAAEADVAAVLRSLASRIAYDATRVGGDTVRTDTPFAAAAAKASPRYNYRGGKPDDVTVVLALVLNDDRSAAIEVQVERERAKEGAPGASGRGA
jgi:hypothetical protein